MAKKEVPGTGKIDVDGLVSHARKVVSLYEKSTSLERQAAFRREEATKASPSGWGVKGITSLYDTARPVVQAKLADIKHGFTERRLDRLDKKTDRFKKSYDQMSKQQSPKSHSIKPTNHKI